MKIASMKNENPSKANASPNAWPKLAMNSGQRIPSSNERIVPETAPTANRISITFDQRIASSRYTGFLVRSQSASAKTTSAGKVIPKQTMTMCQPSDTACICRAGSRLDSSAAPPREPTCASTVVSVPVNARSPGTPHTRHRVRLADRPAPPASGRQPLGRRPRIRLRALEEPELDHVTTEEVREGPVRENAQPP